jgi:WD40 repeat protein
VKRWHVESLVQLHAREQPVVALAMAEDGVQVAAIVQRTVFVGLLGPSGFPAPLLPTEIGTDTYTEAIGTEVRRQWEEFGSRELNATHQLQWTPDGAALWVAGASAVVLYDVAGAVLRSLPRRARVGAIALAPGGDLVLGIGAHVVQIDSETGRLRWQLSGHRQEDMDLVADSDLRGRTVRYSIYVTAVDLARDGRILSASEDGTVRLWPGKGSTDATVFDVGGPVFDACFLDERRAIVALRLGPVFAVDLGTQERLWSVGEPNFNRLVRAFALSKDRRFAAVARGGAEVHILDTRTGELVSSAPLPPGAAAATSLSFTRDASRLLLGTNDGRVALYREDPAGQSV